MGFLHLQFVKIKRTTKVVIIMNNKSEITDAQRCLWSALEELWNKKSIYQIGNKRVVSERTCCEKYILCLLSEH